MSKISNTLSLLRILENGHVYKIKDLASILECSERSVRSYKDDLEKAGIYIESIPGRNGGYYYTCSKDSNYFTFDINDLNILENIYLYLSDNKCEHTLLLDKVIDKMRYLLISNSNISNNSNLNFKDKISIISSAINEGRMLEFIYKNKINTFIPQNMYVYSNNYFVTGINTKINQIRTYSLLDIKKIVKK